MKKVLSLTFAVLLMICLLSAAVRADDVTEYQIWIADVQITSANLTIDGEDSADITSGYAKYDQESKTLTIEDFVCKN